MDVGQYLFEVGSQVVDTRSGLSIPNKQTCEQLIFVCSTDSGGHDDVLDLFVRLLW